MSNIELDGLVKDEKRKSELLTKDAQRLRF